MIKDISVNDKNYIDFNTLELGETFIFYCKDFSEFKILGMKIIDNKYCIPMILDIKDGIYYEFSERFVISKLLDINIMTGV